MKSRHTPAGIPPPDRPGLGVLSSLPTQTPQTSPLAKPMNSASRLSCVVAGLADRYRPKAARRPVPVSDPTPTEQDRAFRRARWRRIRRMRCFGSNSRTSSGHATSPQDPRALTSWAWLAISGIGGGQLEQRHRRGVPERDGRFARDRCRDTEIARRLDDLAYPDLLDEPRCAATLLALGECLGAG